MRSLAPSTERETTAAPAAACKNLRLFSIAYSYSRATEDRTSTAHRPPLPIHIGVHRADMFPEHSIPAPAACATESFHFPDRRRPYCRRYRLQTITFRR